MKEEGEARMRGDCESYNSIVESYIYTHTYISIYTYIHKCICIYIFICLLPYICYFIDTGIRYNAMLLNSELWNDLEQPIYTTSIQSLNLDQLCQNF